MDTREEVYAKLEEGLKSDSRVVVVPRNLMGNITSEEIEKYISLRGYNVLGRNCDNDEVHIHYELKRVSANA